jgi:hypothetical protein
MEKKNTHPADKSSGASSSGASSPGASSSRARVAENPMAELVENRLPSAGEKNWAENTSH